MIYLIPISAILDYKQYHKKTPDQMPTMIISAGQYGQLILPDGSQVWLNSQSRLEFPSEFKTGVREVLLDGEAFFEVTADKKHPFVVHTKHYSVRVLGTKSNVCSFDNDINSEASLLTSVVNNKLNNSKLKKNQGMSRKRTFRIILIDFNEQNQITNMIHEVAYEGKSIKVNIEQ